MLVFVGLPRWGMEFGSLLSCCRRSMSMSVWLLLLAPSFDSRPESFFSTGGSWSSRVAFPSEVSVL